MNDEYLRRVMCFDLASFDPENASDDDRKLARICEHVDRTVAQAPPLNSEQRARLKSILSG